MARRADAASGAWAMVKHRLQRLGLATLSRVVEAPWTARDAHAIPLRRGLFAGPLRRSRPSRGGADAAVRAPRTKPVVGLGIAQSATVCKDVGRAAGCGLALRRGCALPGWSRAAGRGSRCGRPARSGRHRTGASCPNREPNRTRSISCRHRPNRRGARQLRNMPTRVDERSEERQRAALGDGRWRGGKGGGGGHLAQRPFGRRPLTALELGLLLAIRDRGQQRGRAVSELNVDLSMMNELVVLPLARYLVEAAPTHAPWPRAPPLLAHPHRAHSASAQRCLQRRRRRALERASVVGASAPPAMALPDGRHSAVASWRIGRWRQYRGREHGRHCHLEVGADGNRRHVRRRCAFWAAQPLSRAACWAVWVAHGTCCRGTRRSLPPRCTTRPVVHWLGC